MFSLTEVAVCAVLFMLHRDGLRVYHLFDLTERPRLTLGQAYCVAGRGNTIHPDRIIESVGWTPSTAALPMLRFSRTAQADSAMP
jgi:hypothetical protein